MKHGLFTSLLLAVSAAVAAQDLEKGVLFRYDFSRDTNVELKGGAKIRDGALVLDGKNGYALVPGSENMHTGKDGMTIALAVRPGYDPADTELNNVVDMFVSKKKEFLFGKHHENLYGNFSNQKNFCGYSVIPTVPKSGEWSHVTVVFENFNDASQGDVGTRVCIYLNGELETSQKFLYQKMAPGNGKIELGAMTSWGEPWYMKGAIGSVVMYDRPLNAAEIAELCRREKRVKVVRKGFFEVPAGLQKEADALAKEGTVAAKWSASAVLRAAASGTEPAKLEKALQIIRANRNFDWTAFAERCNASQNIFRIFLNDDIAAFILTGEGKGSHPVAGIFNRKTGRELFGERSFYWEIPWRQGKMTGTITANSPDVTWKSVFSGDTLKITWTGRGAIPFTAESSVRFSGPAVESTFAVKNGSKVLFDAVRYPMYSFASMGKGEKMLLPYMCGVVVDDPMTNRFRHGQTGTYPSGRVTLQFGALYNAMRQGIYFSYEDSKARTKIYTADGRRNNLQVIWENPLIADLSKNDFRMSGKAVIRFYEGEWYEAGQIYRKFLEKEAGWWVKDLPRKSTPEWFRNNALWIRLITDTPQKLEAGRRSLKYLRAYFEMPFAVHWYEWNDFKKLTWPHFPPKETTPAVLKEFKALGLHVLPYIDDRLWKVKDGPNGTDYMYTSHGLKYAVRGRNNETYTEDYGHGLVYTVMCPGSKEWQDILVNLTFRLSKEGFSGAYHDQVGTARPIQCFSTAHAHAPNDAACWLEHGYYPIFSRIRETLRTQDPDFSHTTEENSEPYMACFDGYLVTQSVENENVPLFQSIYAGRIQFVGRHFNCMTQGSPQSFYSKVARQLVNAEQLGWCQPSELDRADGRRLFMKKCIFVRVALLDWFNTGRMLAPIDFGKTMKYEQCIWAGYATQAVWKPCIASSAWEGQDGSRMFVFANSVDEVSEAVPAVETKKGLWICREGASAPVFVQKAPALKIAARSFEVWVEGSREQAEAIQATMKKIAGFDCGESAQMRFQYAKRAVKGVPGTYYGVKESTGNMFCNPSANSHHFGWMQDGALIAYGEVDFGAQGTGKITVNVAVDPQCEGGSLEILTTEPGKTEVVSGSITLKSTGGWNSFQEIPVTLKHVLKGKQTVIIRINGNNACNFAGWKYEN